jgi:hypothetical protein
MEMSSSEGIKRAVEANLGVPSLFPQLHQNEVKSGSLVALAIKDLNTKRDIYVVTNKKRGSCPHGEVPRLHPREEARDLPDANTLAARIFCTPVHFP